MKEINYVVKKKSYINNLTSKKNIESLENEIKNKDILINELNIKIKELNDNFKHLEDINKELEAKNVSYSDVTESIKTLVNYINKKGQVPTSINCGGKSFKLKEFLDLQLVKDGKKRILIFEKKNGDLPNYVVIAGVTVDPKVYKTLYNL